MKTIERRLRKVEAIKKSVPLTKEQIDRQTEELLTAKGTTRQQVVAEYGSFGAYCHYLMCQVVSENERQPNSGLSAQEEYMRMLKKVR